MCKTTVAPSDGLGTTLNSVVYFVIYVMDPFHNFRHECAYLFPSGKSDRRNVNKRFLRTNSTFH